MNWLAGLLSLTFGMTGDDFLHGQAQFRQMLQDRPAMSLLLIESDPLMVWAASQFGGATLQRRVSWSDELPPDGVDARHRPGDEQLPSQILVSPVYQNGPLTGRQKSFHDLWSEVIFEFHNLSHRNELQRIQQQALNGQLNVRSWLEAITRIEYKALRATQTFYRTHWRHWMRGRGIEADSYRWAQIRQVPDSYSAWISRYQDLSGYPYANYLEFYNREIRPYIKNRLNINASNPFELSVIPATDEALRRQ